MCSNDPWTIRNRHDSTTKRETTSAYQLHEVDDPHVIKLMQNVHRGLSDLQNESCGTCKECFPTIKTNEVGLRNRCQTITQAVYSRKQYGPWFCAYWTLCKFYHNNAFFINPMSLLNIHHYIIMHSRQLTLNYPNTMSDCSIRLFDSKCMYYYNI